MLLVKVVVIVLFGVIAWSPSDGFSRSINPSGFYRQQQQHSDERLLSSLFHSLHFPSRLSSSTLSLEIYDNVMLPETCHILHQLAMEFSNRHQEEGNDASSIYIRPPFNTNPLTPLEHAMESILMNQQQQQQQPLSTSSVADTDNNNNNDIDTNVDPPKTIVEYWWRDEYMNLDLHSDIDETIFHKEGILSCPDTAHVLYLHVQPDLKGPTCVVSHFGGWNTNTQTTPTTTTTTTTTMVTVPAAQGRLLRFNGSAMHGVPKPIDRWLLSDEEELQLRNMEDEEDMEDQIEEDDNDNYDDNEEEEEEEDENNNEMEEGNTIPERSVLLFNCWSTHGPRGVTPDAIAGTFPEGIDIDEDSLTYMAQQEQQQRDQWVKDFGPNGERVMCQPKSEWKWNDIVDPPHLEDNDTALIRVSLMGNKRRRRYPKKHVRLTAPVKSFRRGVHEELTPTRFFLTHNDTVSYK